MKRTSGDSIPNGNHWEEEEFELKQSIKESHMFAFFLFSFCILVPVSTQLFVFFKTETIDDGSADGKCFLVADHTTSCDGRIYYNYQIFALLMIIVYPIGLPALYFAMLYVSRDQIDPFVAPSTPF